jgi:hypothetical protein
VPLVPFCLQKTYVHKRAYLNNPDRKNVRALLNNTVHRVVKAYTPKKGRKKATPNEILVLTWLPEGAVTVLSKSKPGLF